MSEKIVANDITQLTEKLAKTEELILMMQGLQVDIEQCKLSGDLKEDMEKLIILNNRVLEIDKEYQDSKNG